MVLDPGLGFAKRPEHDWAVLRGLDVLHGLGLPLLVGASRKSFLGRLLGSRGAVRPVTERDPATTALTTWLAVQPTPSGASGCTTSGPAATHWPWSTG